MHDRRNNLLAVLLLAGLVLMAGCPKKKTMPTVTIAQPTGTIEVMADDSVNFIATLENPDNVTTAVGWTATGGTFVPETGLAVKWTAPADSCHLTIYAVATGEGFTDTDTASKAVLTQVWFRGEADVDNEGNESIPAATGTTIASDTFPEPDGDSVPSGALVDSVIATVDIFFGGGNPDSTPDMNVWVQSPDGTQYKIWDESEGAFPSNGAVPFGPLVAFKDKAVAGVWSLVVTTTENNYIPGTINGFDVDIYYRKAVP
jgi:hypothetical protein